EIFDIQLHAYLRPAEVVAQQLSTDNGITDLEAEDRLGRYGSNELSGGGGVSPWKILVGQIFNAMILVLIMA
ncbi:hypothetical protein V1507DRAFT_364970, partial [Lipomyces tetrasporus]